MRSDLNVRKSRLPAVTTVPCYGLVLDLKEELALIPVLVEIRKGSVQIFKLFLCGKLEEAGVREPYCKAYGLGERARKDVNVSSWVDWMNLKPMSAESDRPWRRSLILTASLFGSAQSIFESNCPKHVWGHAGKV